MSVDPALDVLGRLDFLALLRDRYGITLDYETVLERDYRRFLKAGDVVADVGAHQGRHTAVLASLVGGTGMVLAFEPLPAEFAGLKGLVDDYPQVRLHNVALANFDGEGDFVFAAGCPSESGLRQRVYNAPDVANPTRIRVSVRRLDDYTAALSRLDFVKIDIEGGEIDCLKGGLSTLERLRPIVSVEYGASGYAVYGHNRTTLFEFANRIGYSILDLFGTVVDSLPLWDQVCDRVYWDYLLVPQERRDRCVHWITGCP